jgi:hypothetical protein
MRSHPGPSLGKVRVPNAFPHENMLRYPVPRRSDGSQQPVWRGENLFSLSGIKCQLPSLPFCELVMNLSGFPIFCIFVLYEFSQQMFKSWRPLRVSKVKHDDSAAVVLDLTVLTFCKNLFLQFFCNSILFTAIASTFSKLCKTYKCHAEECSVALFCN